jgi:hypothetical protein
MRIKTLEDAAYRRKARQDQLNSMVSILPSKSRINTQHPDKNEYVSHWGPNTTTYMLVDVEQGYDKHVKIIISGSGTGEYYKNGESFYIKHDQSWKPLGKATVIASSVDPKNLPAGNYPLYVLK